MLLDEEELEQFFQKALPEDQIIILSDLFGGSVNKELASGQIKWYEQECIWKSETEAGEAPVSWEWGLFRRILTENKELRILVPENYSSDRCKNKHKNFCFKAAW